MESEMSPQGQSQTRSHASTLIDKRLLIVTGKGGTGKTTVAAAVAHAAQQRGRRVATGGNRERGMPRPLDRAWARTRRLRRPRALARTDGDAHRPPGGAGGVSGASNWAALSTRSDSEQSELCATHGSRSGLARTHHPGKNLASANRCRPIPAHADTTSLLSMPLQPGMVSLF